MVKKLSSQLAFQVTVLFFIFISVWWIWLFFSGAREEASNYLFGATYGLICLWGALWGLFVFSKDWGGWSSLLGRAIIVLSLGLLAQEFGQLVFSYYNIFLKIPVPYPSIADVGFFGTIPFYIYGIFLVAKMAGLKFSLKKLGNQFLAFAIPAIMLILSYAFFLKDYEIDFLDPLRLFLDFGYPFGEAIYISIALLTYGLSRNLLGGVMRGRILFIVAAFVIQYIAEFNFLYQSMSGTWLNGGYGDYLYFLAYTMMTLGLIQFKVVADDLEGS